MDLSFDTISSRRKRSRNVTTAMRTNLSGQLEMNTLYLVDSGGQYLNALTDITRTIAIGQPSEEMIQQFTLAPSHIGIARARFPQGTRGFQLDTPSASALMARAKAPIMTVLVWCWSLPRSVHEGPQSISGNDRRASC